MLAAGATVACLGLAAILSGNAGLTLTPGFANAFAPLQPNVALAFLACGLGLLANVFRPKAIVFWCGIVGTLIGVLALPGLDELARAELPSWAAARFGRLSFGTALGLMCAGGALVLGAGARPGLRLWTMVLGALAGSTSVIALTGILSGVETSYEWSHVTAMPVEVAAGLLILSLGILAGGNRCSTAMPTSQCLNTALIVGIGAMTLTVCLWQMLMVQERLRFARMARNEAANLSSEIVQHWRGGIMQLVSMARRWDLSSRFGNEQYDEWQADALDHVRHAEGIQRIVLRNEATGIAWVVPEPSDSGRASLPAIWGNAAIETSRRAVARDDVAVSKPVAMESGDTGLVVSVPLHSAIHGKGSLDAVLDASVITARALATRTRNFSLALLQGSHAIYMSAGGGTRFDDLLLEEQLIDLYGSTWRLRTWPTPSLAASTRSVVPEVVLVVGVLVGLLLVITTLSAQTAQLRTIQAEEINRRLQAEVAEHRQNKKTLRRSEERFRAILESTADGVVTITPDGIVDMFNPAAETIFGYTADEVIGRNVSFLAAQPYRAEHDGYLRRFLDTGEARAIGKEREAVGIRRDGTTFPIALRVRQMRRQDGSRMFAASIQDISERKRVEGDLRLANKQLKATNTALQVSQMNLVQAAKLESVGRLAAGVAHEVKNPLGTILLGVDYLSERVADTDENSRTLLEDMRVCIKRADSVVRELLDFASPRELELAPDDVALVISRALALAKADLMHKHVHVVRDIAEDLPPIEMDSQKIEQVLLNMIVNACHSMSDGGTLTIRVSCDSTASEQADHPQDEGRLTVELDDTGAGIPEDMLQQVFDPFFTTKPPGQGTGLGLSVCRTIMERHRGAIMLRNRPEGGVRGTLLFPLAIKESKTWEPEESSSSMTRKASRERFGSTSKRPEATRSGRSTAAVPGSMQPGSSSRM